MSGVKVNGQWRNTGPAYVKINNDWRTVSESFVKVAGIWQRSTLGSPPAKPTIVYHAFGQFRITNYDPTLDYQERFAGLPGMSGGDAQLNTSTGIYSLTGENSGFYVSAAYAAGAPRSQEAYMERKKRRFSCRPVFGQVCDTCCQFIPGDCSCISPGPEGCPEGSSPNGQCGCGTEGRPVCMTGSIGGNVCNPCNCRTEQVDEICDVLINEPGFTYTGAEWYKDDKDG